MFLETRLQVVQTVNQVFGWKMSSSLLKIDLNFKKIFKSKSKNEDDIFDPNIWLIFCTAWSLVSKNVIYKSVSFIVPEKNTIDFRSQPRHKGLKKWIEIHFVSS